MVTQPDTTSLLRKPRGLPIPQLLAAFQAASEHRECLGHFRFREDVFRELEEPRDRDGIHLDIGYPYRPPWQHPLSTVAYQFLEFVELGLEAAASPPVVSWYAACPALCPFAPLLRGLFLHAPAVVEQRRPELRSPSIMENRENTQSSPKRFIVRLLILAKNQRGPYDSGIVLFSSALTRNNDAVNWP